MTRRRWLVVTTVIAALLGVAVLAVTVGPLHTFRVEVQTIAAPVTTGKCHSVDGLPDPKCTPGYADPRVTQDNIQSTICVSGYTSKVRPSSLYTSALKTKQIKEYGYSDTDPSHYEEDHLIPLELGGHPTDPRNLWPEPLVGDQGAVKKDGVENSLHSKVCSGQMMLAIAQAAIANNWESAR